MAEQAATSGVADLPQVAAGVQVVLARLVTRTTATADPDFRIQLQEQRVGMQQVVAVAAGASLQILKMAALALVVEVQAVVVQTLRCLAQQTPEVVAVEHLQVVKRMVLLAVLEL